MGAAVGLAARGILPDSSVPTSATAGPTTSVRHASVREIVTSGDRAVDPLSTTVGRREAGYQPGGARACSPSVCSGHLVCLLMALCVLCDSGCVTGWSASRGFRACTCSWWRPADLHACMCDPLLLLDTCCLHHCL